MPSTLTRSLLGTDERPELVLRRILPAAPQEVLAACTDRGRLAEWFGPVDGQISAVGEEFTARIGGGEPAGGTVMACTQDGFSVTWAWNDEVEKGVISVRVAPVADGPDGAPRTELTLLHVLPAAEHAPALGRGWELVLISLARHLGQGDAVAAAEVERATMDRWRAMVARPVELHWHLRAPVERVWRELTGAEELTARWRETWQDVTVEVAAAPGAGYRITSAAAGISLSGTFLIVDAPRALAMTRQLQDARTATEDETVEIALSPAEADGTILSLRHTGPWDDQDSARAHHRDWEEALTALEHSLTV